MIVYLIWLAILVIILGFLYFNFFSSKINQLFAIQNHQNYQLIQKLNLRIKEWQEDERNNIKTENYFKNHLLVSISIDNTIEELVDLFLKDYFLNWYTSWSLNDSFTIKCLIKNEIWLLLSRILSMFSHFDNISFFTKNLIITIHLHFKRISCALERKDSYSLYSHLESPEKEIDYLRNLSNLILKLVLPSKYYSICMITTLFQEILAIHVLHNFINTISNPDFINQKIAEYIHHYHLENEKGHKNYAYAETYEDFINLINKCQNVQELKNIQYDVICEIMQASALNNYKQEKCDKESRTITSSLPNVKGGLLLNRDLKRYINQLRFAKNLCSKKIHLLSNYALNSFSTTSLSNFYPLPQKKILSFSTIIANDTNRSFFKKFLQDSIGVKTSLQNRNSKYLLLLWEKIQEMKTRADINPYKTANEILKHSYFLNSINSFTKIRKNIQNGMESYVKGDNGPESFYEVQSLVYEILEDRYYPLFIVSKEYDAMIGSLTSTVSNQNIINHNISNITKRKKKRDEEEEEEVDEDDEDEAKLMYKPINEHIAIAYAKLKAMKQKIVDKGKAMDGIKECYDLTTNNFDYNLISSLGKEVVELQEKIYQLENYIKWSKQWISYLGQWKAKLHNIEINSEKQTNSPLAIVILYFNQNNLDTSGSGGWMIGRTIQEFINLKRKCARINPHLKKFEILRLNNVSSANVDLINKASKNLQMFLNELFKNENCQKSEHVYLFFCPIPKTLRSPNKRMCTNRWNLLFASFFGIKNFKTDSNKLKVLDQPNDELSNHFLNLEDELENKDDNIAEPLYNLLIEIFGIKGATGFLRKTLITFVQIVGEKTINKEIKETVSWMCSESMFSYYISCLKEILWPNGQLAKPKPQNSEQVKKHNQLLAKQLISDNIPQILIHLFGQQNCRKGLMKIFEYLQDQNLNKQFIYDTIETFFIQFVNNLKLNQVK